MFLTSGIPLPPVPTQNFNLSFETYMAFPDHSHLFWCPILPTPLYDMYLFISNYITSSSARQRSLPLLG